MEQNSEDQLRRIWSIASNVMPPVGLYIYFRHRRTYPNKARRALSAALMGIPAAIIGGYIFNTYILV